MSKRTPEQLAAVLIGKLRWYADRATEYAQLMGLRGFEDLDREHRQLLAGLAANSAADFARLTELTKVFAPRDDGPAFESPPPADTQATPQPPCPVCAGNAMREAIAEALRNRPRRHGGRRKAPPAS